MGDENGGTVSSDKERHVAPWADGDNLRVVEKEVLIPKIMKEKAKVKCAEYVDAFVECSKGRTLSMLWACREATTQMQNCLSEKYHDPAFFEECKEIYLKERETFQSEFVETGKTKRTFKKDAAF